MTPLESRPLPEVYPRNGGPNARALAIQSSRKRRKAKARPAKLTPAARHYLEGELRWQAELKRKAKPTSTVTKAARARKLMRHEFSARERDEMVRKGISMFDGTYAITTAAELHRAIRLASEPGTARDGLRWHCIKRAAGMGLANLIPDRWNGDGSLK